MLKKLSGGTLILLLISGSAARAQLLDTLFPPEVPGYGQDFSVLPERRAPAPDVNGMFVGQLLLAPELEAQAGYDSAPGGTEASSLFSLKPSLTLSDALLGFGAYAAVEQEAYPENAAQNMFGSSIAAGERAVLPGQTVTLSAGYLRGEENDYTLNSIISTKPVAYALADGRLSDEISAGLFTLTPSVSVLTLEYPDYRGENHTDLRASLTTSYDDGGPATFLSRVQFLQSSTQIRALGAQGEAALGGFRDAADGLWTLSLLAGFATRRPVSGRDITAPVAEGALDWVPDGLDRMRLTLAREVDDPDEITAAPYTLSEARFALRHEVSRKVELDVSGTAGNAAFYGSALRQTILAAGLEADYRLNAALRLTAAYAFNSTQANFSRAANAQTLTLGLAWMP